MKRLLLIALIPFLLASTAQADTISLRADLWCPFSCEADSEKPGVFVEIAREIFEAAGHQVDYKTMNWARAIAEARQGMYAGLVGACKGDVPEFLFPEPALSKTTSCFFTGKASKWKYSGIPSLKGLRVGVIQDYSYGAEIDGYIKSGSRGHTTFDAVSGENPLESNIQKLKLGRLDAFIDDMAVVTYGLKDLEKQKAIRPAGCFEETEIFVAFSPAHPKGKEYTKLFSEGIHRLRQSGRLRKIFERYGLREL